MDKTKMILFCRFIKMTSTELEQSIKDTKFDMTDVILHMMSQKTKNEITQCEFKLLYDKFDPLTNQLTK